MEGLKFVTNLKLLSTDVTDSPVLTVLKRTDDGEEYTEATKGSYLAYEKLEWTKAALIVHDIQILADAPAPEGYSAFLLSKQKVALFTKKITLCFKSSAVSELPPGTSAVTDICITSKKVVSLQHYTPIGQFGPFTVNVRKQPLPRRALAPPPPPPPEKVPHQLAWDDRVRYLRQPLSLPPAPPAVAVDGVQSLLKRMAELNFDLERAIVAEAAPVSG
eukprot:m.226764 g.226764  ORF g.226764 m.226764 type:complete len:218 (+) comp11476_c0_seq1:746-1399(+)